MSVTGLAYEKTKSFCIALLEPWGNHAVRKLKLPKWRGYVERCLWTWCSVFQATYPRWDPKHHGAAMSYSHGALSKFLTHEILILLNYCFKLLHFGIVIQQSLVETITVFFSLVERISRLYRSLNEFLRHWQGSQKILTKNPQMDENIKTNTSKFRSWYSSTT